MTYDIQYKPAAKRFIKKLASKKILRDILDSIIALANAPRPDGVKKLKRNKKQDLYRIRVGEYRVVYQIEDNELIVLVVRIRHRKEVYEELKNV